MTLPLYYMSCAPLSLHDIPEDTYHLSLEGLPEEKVLRGLFASLPQLTRLTFRQRPDYYSDCKPLGVVLKQTPHVTALHLNQCQLDDVTLLKLLEGCSVELCELNLNYNNLYFADSSLITRLGYFTNLQ